MTTQLQQHIIEVLGVKPDIDPEEEIRTRIDFLKEFTLRTGVKGFVLGISGGQDSALAGKLAQQAVNELNAENNTNEYTFIAMKLPYGVQKDANDVETVLAWIQPTETITFNIKDTVDAFADTYEKATGKPIADYHKGNVKARERMVAQYAVAGANKLVVIGTDQAVEAVSGFFTKQGDGAADILPISGLNKEQGRELLRKLDVPTTIITKAPTADLLDNVPGQADETELGVTYEVLDAYLEGKETADVFTEQIETRYLNTEHKRQLPITPNDTWWK